MNLLVLELRASMGKTDGIQPTMEWLCNKCA